ncbi:hypothetical protein FKM82_008266 [Ascaphus truei]
MDAGGANGSTGQAQDIRGQSSVTYISNPLMNDVISDWSLIHDAAIHGRLLALNKLINQGCRVNLITADQVSPLHEACLGGHPACVSVLLKHGAQVNNPSIDWQTPMFNACVSGNVACVNLLLQHGASPNAACDVASPIHEAAKRGHTECVESLASAGVSVQQYVKHLGSPLYVACENEKEDTAKKLLELGEKPFCSILYYPVTELHPLTGIGGQQHTVITTLFQIALFSQWGSKRFTIEV